tara:strand:- start:7431 stop:7658 length:228 start_codon:yes stop_codon:yes gene_type:complete
MTGYGDILDGIHGANLTDGQYSDMIDGDTIYTMVGITMDGDMVGITTKIIGDGVKEGIITAGITGIEVLELIAIV